MTRLLVDTSAYSAFMRSNEAIKYALQRAEAIYVNPIILGELRAGFQRGRHRGRNEEILAQFLASPRVSVVAVDEETAERYAVILNRLRDVGTPIPTNDIWIAASAMQHGSAVLTTDAHFLKVQQIIVHHFPSS